MIDYHGNEFERMIGRSRLVTEDQRMALVRQPHEMRGCCGPGSVADDYRLMTRRAAFLWIREWDDNKLADAHWHGEAGHYHPGGSQPHPNDFDHSVAFPVKRLDHIVK